MSPRLVILFLLTRAAVVGQSTAPSKPETIVIATANIEGVVIDSMTGQPLAGARLTLRRIDAQSASQQSQAPLTATTDTQGQFILEDVLVGRFRLFANRSGYVSMEYGARAPGATGVPIELTGEQDLRDISFRLLPQSILSGRVTAEDGKSLRGVMVQALRLRYAGGRRQFLPVAGSVTGPGGEYRITGLAPGRYYVVAKPAPGQKHAGEEARSDHGNPPQEYISAFYPAEEDGRSASAVDIGAAMQVGRIDVRLRLGEVAAIRGTVSNSITGQPVTGAVITITPADASELGLQLSRTAMSDDTGKFEVAGLRLGQYVVSADMFDGDTRYSATLMTIARNPADDTALLLVRGVTLTGQVRDGDRTHLYADVQVQLQSLTDSVLGRVQGKTNQGGTFELDDVVPGRFTIGASKLPEGTYIESVRYGDRELPASTVTVSAGIVLPLEIVLGTSGATASGTVLDTEGKPVPGAVIALVPDSSRGGYDYLYSTVTANDAGKFSITSIAPGQYTAFAWREADDAGYLDSSVVKRVDAYGVSVDLSQAKAATVELHVIPSGI